MNQPNLFGDTIWDSLEQLIAALGGMKRVGFSLRPDLSPDKAGQWLRDALNPEHRTGMTPDKLLELLRMAHAKGIHVGMDHICDDLGYERTKPINKVNRVAELQKEFNRSVARLDEIAELLKANGVHLRGVS